MLRKLALVLTLAVLATSMAVRPVRAAGAGSRRTAVVAAVEKAHRCVVSISSEKKAESHSRWPFSAEENQRPRVNGMGTGVVVDQRGYVLTNHHVVDKVQDIVVQFSDGATCPARVLQSDAAMDLAVLKVDAPRPLAAISVGTSSDLMVGETVITIGNAYGYENTVSVGIISALHRDVTLSDEQVYRNLIQTDACINPGNSGGPLINIDGDLIGLNVAVRAGAQGIGFALPIDEVMRVAADLMSTRRLASTWHGLVAMDRYVEGRREVVVSEVEPASPAETAGFKVGDTIVQAGGLAVTNDMDLERGLLDARPGHPSKVVVRRGGKEQTVAIDVQTMPANSLAGNTASVDLVWRLLGVKTVHVPPEYVTAISPRLRGGLFVQAVSPNSRAAAAAIEKGDILVGMKVGARHWETVWPDNIIYVLQQPESNQTESALFYVVRKNAVQSRRINLGVAVTQSALNR